MKRLAAVGLVLLLSCTEQKSPPAAERDAPTPGPTETAQPPPKATIRLVVDDPELAPYVDGIRMAAEEIDREGEIDLRLLEAPSVQAALSLKPEAILAIGGARSIAENRLAIEEAGIPVVLLAGDLYTPRSMFRWVFQTAIPWRWQASVIARYLVVDRQHERVGLVVRSGPEEGLITQTFAAAMAEERGAIAETIAVAPGDTFDGDIEAFDAVVVAADTALAEDVSDRLPSPTGGPQLALSVESAAWPVVVGTRLPWGTVTPYAYTWSTWAEPIPRVSEFMERFRQRWGVEPEAHQQEGYDAMRALAEALVRAGGEGADLLVRTLEGFRDETYSSLPVRLGPDDHVIAEQSHLGLFAIEGETTSEDVEGEALGPTPWRPVLRTFTTDGEKVNFLDRDKRIFFPFWRPKRPTPKYWRAEYGIVSRPSDPLH